ncbi:alpha/beta fold hydrolase [Microbacterium sp. C5A9]|uniref:alpha/beta fold hydrolase n=1 Tax=Microbacterium sp. C5A9 TaxID=2736663 RepID=UPI0035AC1699
MQDALDPQRWDAVAVPLPGSPGGASGPATIGHAVRTVVEVLEGLPCPAVLVGHSMGAQVTLLAHGLMPDLVQSEVVIDAAYAGDPASRSQMARWAAAIERDGLPRVSKFFALATRGMPPDAARRVLADVNETTPAVIASYLRSEYVDPDAIGLSPATQGAARSRRKPVLSLHSTHDSMRREASLVTPPGSASNLWDGHGHYLHLEDPTRFARVLLDWRRMHGGTPRGDIGHRVAPLGRAQSPAPR